MHTGYVEVEVPSTREEEKRRFLLQLGLKSHSVQSFRYARRSFKWKRAHRERERDEEQEIPQRWLHSRSPTMTSLADIHDPRSNRADTASTCAAG